MLRVRHLRPAAQAVINSPVSMAAARTRFNKMTPTQVGTRAVSSASRSPWKTTDSVALSRESMLDLLYGRTPLIKELGFLTPSECFKYEQELSALVTPYTHNTGPTLRKVGIAQVR